MIMLRVEKEKEEKLPMTKHMEIGGRLFLDGFKSQLFDESTAGVALAGGLWQGMKYRGDIFRGIKAGAMIELTLCTLNGVKNVMKNYKKTCQEEE